MEVSTTQRQLDIELDYFSRYFDKQYYFSAIAIYNEAKSVIMPTTKTDDNDSDSDGDHKKKCQ